MVSPIHDDKPDPSDSNSVVRAARVDALRRAIAAGTYKIPSGKVADKVIEDMIRKP
jgi:flagellar biosynthesis anti-sigma factor FlgM